MQGLQNQYYPNFATKNMNYCDALLLAFSLDFEA